MHSLLTLTIKDHNIKQYHTTEYLGLLHSNLRGKFMGMKVLQKINTKNKFLYGLKKLPCKSYNSYVHACIPTSIHPSIHPYIHTYIHTYILFLRVFWMSLLADIFSFIHALALRVLKIRKSSITPRD